MVLFSRPAISKSKIKNLLYKCFGFPHIGTRIRGNAVFRLFNPGEKSVVLDMGFGSGNFTLELLNRNYNCFGIDLLKGISFQNALDLKESAEKIGRRAKLVVADATFLPFKSESFDGLVIADVIEHIPDENAVMREINRVLKHGGIFVASTPTEGFHHGKFKGFFRRIRNIPLIKNLNIWNDVYLYPDSMMRTKGHQREYSLEKWENLCDKHGFKLNASAPEYKFFEAFFVELSHTFKLFARSNAFFYLFYPITKLDAFIPAKGTGIAIRGVKIAA